MTTIQEQIKEIQRKAEAYEGIKEERQKQREELQQVLQALKAIEQGVQRVIRGIDPIGTQIGNTLRKYNYDGMVEWATAYVQEGGQLSTKEIEKAFPEVETNQLHYIMKKIEKAFPGIKKVKREGIVYRYL